jgi:hypothetical protein
VLAPQPNPHDNVYRVMRAYISKPNKRGEAMQELRYDLFLFIFSYGGITACIIAYGIMHYLLILKNRSAAEAMRALKEEVTYAFVKKTAKIVLCLASLLSSSYVSQNLSRFITVSLGLGMMFYLLLHRRNSNSE